MHHNKESTGIYEPPSWLRTCTHSALLPTQLGQAVGDLLCRAYPLPAELARLAGGLRELALLNHTCGQEELAVLSSVRYPGGARLLCSAPSPASSPACTHRGLQVSHPQLTDWSLCWSPYCCLAHPPCSSRT